MVNQVLAVLQYYTDLQGINFSPARTQPNQLFNVITVTKEGGSLYLYGV